VKRTACIFVVMWLGSGCGSDPGPAVVVSRFYETYAAIGSHGLPNPGELATFSPFLTPRLLAQIDSAHHMQVTYSRQHPDDKPPFVDQDLFSSNFEGYSGYMVDTVTALGGGRYRVRVNFWYADPLDSSAVVRWHDAVYVVPNKGGYLIDDIEFLAPWPFAQKGRLSEALRGSP
jgi:hypothetical protein